MDKNLFREEKGNNPEIIRESQRRRFANVDIVDELIELDKESRKRKVEVENQRKEFNKVNKQVRELKKSGGGDATELHQQAAKIKQDIIIKEAEARKAQEAFTCLLETVGNLVHDSVPVSNKEADNVEVEAWGKRRYLSPGGQKLRNHVDLALRIGILDLKRGVKIAGSRGFIFEEEGAELCRALINFSLDFLKTRGFKEKRVPHMMRKNAIARLEQHDDEELYKVTSGEGEEEDKYLIATVEQPLVAYHMDEWIQPSELPKRYSAASYCFRKEVVDKHGINSCGFFRVRKIQKVEQFCMTGPNGDDSWEMFEDMIQNSKDFYKALNIPYRVVSVVSGALNKAAAKKYDLEGWFPASQRYSELVSCSNCTDYQARRLEIRYGHNHNKAVDKTKHYVHTLNSTLCAIEKTICCILENYQREDGVEIPELLQPYMGGMTFLPFDNSYMGRNDIFGWYKDNRPLVMKSLFRFGFGLFTMGVAIGAISNK